MTIAAPDAPARTHPADAVARRLFGRPLYPHQLDAAVAMSAKSTNGAGLYAHPRVVILWPRQTGKTTMLLCVALARALAMPDYRAVYAAQTGHITTKRFTDWLQLTARYPALFAGRRSQGTEAIRIPANGSYLEAFPPVPGRLRSASLDLVIVDEAQEHSDELGRKLDADIVPTFDTRPRRQWVISGTAGGIDSEYFRRHYKLAKDGAPGYLLLEAGTPPAEHAGDADVVAAHHPGVRHGMTTAAAIADARTALGQLRFAREYGNRWDTASVESALDLEAWTRCKRLDLDPTDRHMLALEVQPDRDRAVLIGASTTTEPGVTLLQVTGDLELAPAVQLAKANSDAARCPVVVDPQAPTVTHIRRLRRAGVPILETTFRDVTAAAMALYDRTKDATIAHRGDARLDAAVAAAQARRLQSRWTFERSSPGGPMMMAAALAAWHLDTREHTPDRGLTAG